MISRILAHHRRARIIRRLEATMRPDPDFRGHRLAQFSPERRERYWRNVDLTP